MTTAEIWQPAAILRQPPHQEAYAHAQAATSDMLDGELQSYLDEHGLLGLPEPEGVVSEAVTLDQAIMATGVPIAYLNQIVPPVSARHLAKQEAWDVNLIFTRDLGAMVPYRDGGNDKYVISSLGKVRESQDGYLEAAIGWWGGRKVDLRLAPEELVEGGDVYVMWASPGSDEHLVFVGIGERTTEGGAKAIRHVVPEATQVVTAVHPEGLHFNTVCGAIQGPLGKAALLAENAFDNGVTVYGKGHERTGRSMTLGEYVVSRDFEVIPVPLEAAIQGEACNGLQLGAHYLASDRLTQPLAEEVEEATGTKVTRVHLPHTNKLQGGVNCTTLELDSVVAANLHKAGLLNYAPAPVF